MTRYYINLTNGLEFLPDLQYTHYGFCRIQSTACEQKRWGFILNDLDHDLLLNLALGNLCIIVDCGSKGKPRALWQGTEWILYALTRCWFGCGVEAHMRSGCDCTAYFRQQYNNLSKPELTKIKYYRKFLQTERVLLKVDYRQTTHDGDYEYLRGLAAMMA